MVSGDKIVIIFLVVISVFSMLTLFAFAFGVTEGRAEVFTGEAVCEYVSDKVFCAKKVGE